MSDWKNVQYKDGKYRTNSGGSDGIYHAKNIVLTVG